MEAQVCETNGRARKMDQKRFAAMGMLVPSAVTTVLLLSLFFKNPTAMTRLTLIPLPP